MAAKLSASTIVEPREVLVSIRGRVDAKIFSTVTWAEGPNVSRWKRMFRGSEKVARELMSARRWRYSGDMEDVVWGFGGRDGSIVN